MTVGVYGGGGPPTDKVEEGVKEYGEVSICGGIHGGGVVVVGVGGDGGH